MQPSKFKIIDCGCVASRPQDPSCRSYGTRWRVYHTSAHIILKCRDCGKLYYYELRRIEVQITMYDAPERISKEEQDGMR